MGYSIIRYLRNFPLRYYLKGGLAQMRGPTISLFLSAQQSAALICRGRRAQGFELEVVNLLGAPPLNGVDSAFAPASRSFSQKLLARSRARGVPRFIFVPDLTSSDLYCNVHSVTNLREVHVESLLESLREDPRQVFGSWDESRKFRWEVFNALNRANFGLPNRTINSSNVGTITTLAGDPRVMQFALRLNF